MCKQSAIFSLTSANCRLVSLCLVLILPCGTSLLPISPHKPPEAFLCRKEAGERGKIKRVGEDGKGKEKKKKEKKRGYLLPLPVVHCSLTVFDFVGLASFISWR